MKDAIVTLDGILVILSIYLNFGQLGRSWGFRFLERGQVNFEEIIRALNEIEYVCPLSVGREDAVMDLVDAESIKKIDFSLSGRLFDEEFSK